MIFASLFTVLNMYDSKLPNARGLPNVIILPPYITSFCILNIPAFIQTRKRTLHSNRQKKRDNDLAEDPPGLHLSSDEKSPCNALPHSSVVLIKLFVLATIPPFYTQLCGPGAEILQILFLSCRLAPF